MSRGDITVSSQVDDNNNASRAPNVSRRMGRSIRDAIRELKDSTRGAEMVEMIIIVAVVLGIVFLGTKFFGSKVESALSAQGSSIQSIGSGVK